MASEETQFDVKDLPWFECLEILLHDYEPAERQEAALVMWSTRDITNALIAHYGDDKINPQQVYECMLFLGYNYTSQGSLQLEWMLTRK